ncbi:Olfactory receptor 18 [Sciurus carolinensis]|uniref:Olfactory receptor 18 n=1 Tax=Sciurus carolinensis TaxID=30640 RepID=A0AA41T371_SCICA|nr:Olfactory receptor 18 [Sciurus carolinensis]
MIVGILTQSRIISYVSCLTQMPLFLIFACMDDFLLTVMAYDWFVAICHPLHYPVIMSPRLCGFLVLLLNLTCSDTFSNNIVKYTIGAFYGLFPLSGILFSYYKIVSSILRIQSSSGKYKDFSTCGSHLAVVCLFYGTAFGVYLGSAVSHSSRKGVLASVIYTVVTPMLNPFIYSLRNRDIKSSLRRVHSRTA